MDTPQSVSTLPRAVVLACQLFVASYVLGLVVLLPGVGAPAADPSIESFLALIALLVAWGAITLWLIGAVLRRKNWGRWAMLAVLGLSWLVGADDIVETFQNSLAEGAIDVFCTVLEMTGCVLLFGGAATQWFVGADATGAP